MEQCPSRGLSLCPCSSVARIFLALVQPPGALQSLSIISSSHGSAVEGDEGHEGSAADEEVPESADSGPFVQEEGTSQPTGEFTYWIYSDQTVKFRWNTTGQVRWFKNEEALKQAFEEIEE